jgi:hypothetical protein
MHCDNSLIVADCGGFMASAEPAEVVQGKCIDLDKEAKRVVLEEYNTEITKDSPYGKPSGVMTVLDFSSARIGIPPEIGDVLRIAYTMEKGIKRAVKVMNVSKQDLRKK